MPEFVVVTAAGSGLRLGYNRPKALIELGGIPLVRRAVDGVKRANVAGVVVTAPLDHLSEFEAIFADEPDISVVAGGDVRQASVYNGLKEIPKLARRLGVDLTETTPVLIHDAARCLTPSTVIDAVIKILEGGIDAVVPAVPVTDTQKVVAPSDAGLERVVGQVNRAELRAVQTPQGFHWGTIMRAHEEGMKRLYATGLEATDDAGLVEALGQNVFITPGSPLSLKITTKLDMVVADLLISNAELAKSFQ